MLFNRLILNAGSRMAVNISRYTNPYINRAAMHLTSIGSRTGLVHSASNAHLAIADTLTTARNRFVDTVGSFAVDRLTTFLHNGVGWLKRKLSMFHNIGDHETGHRDDDNPPDKPNTKQLEEAAIHETQDPHIVSTDEDTVKSRRLKRLRPSDF